MLDTTPPAIDRPRVDSYWIDRKRVEIDREPVDRCEIDRDPVDRSGGYVQLTLAASSSARAAFVSQKGLIELSARRKSSLPVCIVEVP